MDTTKLKKFAQFARRTMRDQVETRLDLVLDDASYVRRENPEAVKDLETEISKTSRDQVIERVAYIWFNRFSALRYMDVNDINSVRVVSSLPGQFQPEILTEAKAGNIDERIVPEKTCKAIRDLLDGRAPSQDPQAEAYRLLLVAICNDWHKAMPFMFERIDDFTELLMPEDLLSGDSILAYTREAMTPDVCQDVEVIGWLYQFYISEKKDQVFAGLKKNQKITPENIPAATQLFTPHWIVRYLVENSLGRLWLLNHPQSTLAEKMDYYIAPVEPEEDFLRIERPEDIRICDPACGSGHMLTYAFDLLYVIYEDEGYAPSDIPSLILTNNLYGIEIDERAGALSAFALTMKACGQQRRFFRKSVTPNICVLQNVTFEAQELADYTAKVGRDLFTDDLRETLEQFSEAKNFGSLIVPKLKDRAEVARVIGEQDFAGDMLYADIHTRVLTVLRMTHFLSPKYHVVVANPPYMGGKGMNERLKSWAVTHYPDSKSDFFAMFMERGLELIRKSGFSAMVTMESWMFLSSFEKLRTKLLGNATIQSMVHMPYLGKGGTSMGINFGTTAFVAEKLCKPKFQGRYCCVRYFETDKQGVPFEFPPQNERLSTASSDDFSKIPGSPIAYWVSRAFRECFENFPLIQNSASAVCGMTTGENAKFVREWHEIGTKHFGSSINSSDECISSGKKWFPYAKGGEFRKWYGNADNVVNWENDGHAILASGRAYPRARKKYFQPSVSWSFLSSSYFGVRQQPFGFIFDMAGCSLFPENHNDLEVYTGVLCAKTAHLFLKAMNPTMNFQVNNVGNIPFPKLDDKNTLKQLVIDAVLIGKSDWNAYETSWDFSTLPLLSDEHRAETLETTYARLRQHWQQMTNEMQCLEEENNRIFINAYSLQDELTPEVPIEEITLTCNPAYRYGVKIDEAEREKRLRADTMREFLSYAVGCMFGRYSLDEPGLILANQGAGMAEYLANAPQTTFEPDDDNVIPVLGGDWFPDDIAERFRKFLRITFGEEKFRENLTFIENALGKDIRKYFTKDFYNDHVKRYKKRPIYWVFSSPKGTFNALIYMHRYRPDTVSVVLNDYLREFINKLQAEHVRLEKLSDDPSASQVQQTKALKDVTNIVKQLDELHEWERDVIFPLAQQKIEIDLDDGVKANYPLFGKALKKVTGLS